ncbi:MAG TPA: hypothetical protein VN687_19190 [Blastocatellia bacterium]|nr:hypothetical protein [Blastocatellia bacterium]
MFCPQCGSNQSDDIKFCKTCGGNLFAVRQAVSMRDLPEKFDWSKTWVAEMFLSGGEREKRKEQLELQRGITPEVKRQKELKAGVITSSVGIGVSIFLYVIMQGVIGTLHNPGSEVEILSRVWVAGVIPFFIGLGLILASLLVGRDRRKKVVNDTLESGSTYQSLPASDAERFARAPSSVTDQTTRQLKDSDQ